MRWSLLGAVLGFISLVGFAAARVEGPQRTLVSPREPTIHAPDVTFARVADFDGDGDVDILATEPDPQNRIGGRITPNVHWYPNGDWKVPGAGQSFGPARVIGNPRRFDAQTFTITMATPADLNADGHPDVLALVYRKGAGTHGLYWAANDGEGGFGEFALVERNDGRKIDDLTPDMRYVEAADVDHEGGEDFFLVDEDHETIFWWKNLGPPAAPQFRRYTAAYMQVNDAAGTRVHAIDMDHDGEVDMVGIVPGKDAPAQTGPQGEIYWWRHQSGSASTYGGHEFVRQPLIGRQANLLDVAAVAYDDDQLPDILGLGCRTRLRRSALSQVILWHNTGQDGDFTAVSTAEANTDRDIVPPPPISGGVWNSLDVGDMNGDGAPDFVASEPVNEFGVQANQGMLCWYKNPYHPVAVPTSTATSPYSPTATPTVTPYGGATPATPTPAEATATTAPTATPRSSLTSTAPTPPSATPDIIETAVAATLTALAPTASSTPTPLQTPDIVGTRVAATLTAMRPTATRTRPAGSTPSLTPGGPDEGGLIYLPYTARNRALGPRLAVFEARWK